DIDAVLSILETAAARLRSGERVAPDVLSGAVTLLGRFADEYHHAKEEQALFPLLARYRLGPETSFIAALKAQHEIDRAYLLEIKEGVERLAGGDVIAGPALATVLREYVDLTKEHVRLEESYFDGLIAETITPADDARLVEQFETIDRMHGKAGSDGTYR